jgi:hypothetical protein
MSAHDLDRVIEEMDAETPPGDSYVPSAVVREWLATLRHMRARAVEVRAEAVDPDDTACSCALARSYEVHHECGHVWKLGEPALLIPEDTSR